MSSIAYKNELILALAFLLLVSAFFYKEHIVSNDGSSANDTVQLVQDIKESIALKALWGDKKLTKKIESLKFGISPSKFKWSRKGKKLQAVFTSISGKELNMLMKKIMNMAIEIQKIDINKMGSAYTLELKCKW
ncbi:hypothetical protein MNB_SV-13-776 [hydrothermal vent metagenome]|uniref:Uncharacterized protein n=1 Tax=hydrothermal vent metagenome TaxID=652676 RepID=A0A1W1CZE4_9ZZZZ